MSGKLEEEPRRLTTHDSPEALLPIPQPADPFWNDDVRGDAAIVTEGPSLKDRGIVRTNAGMLHNALQFCASNGIGRCRINSRILPLSTRLQHDALGLVAPAVRSPLGVVEFVIDEQAVLSRVRK